MRAKMKVNSVELLEGCEILKMSAVCKSGSYPAGGADEDNTFALFTPAANLTMQINNPVLMETFAPGDLFYVDFTKVKK